MPSRRARALNVAVRLLIRRRRWGGERRLTLRARLLFGVPAPLGRLRTRGVAVRSERSGAVRGEWVEGRGSQAGVVLYLHGGGFVSCSPATHRPITAGLARRLGARVFAVDYRRAPEHRYPAALDDCVAAYLWLLDRGIPASGIALAGDSAGGGLVLSVLVRVRELGREMPACAVCFSPWTDLAGKSDSVTANDARCAMFRTGNIEQFAAVYLGDRSREDPAASPVYAELGGLPPLLLQVGSTELLLDDARRVHARARAAGVQCELRVFDDLFHCWQMLDGYLPEAKLALDEAARFIGGHLAREKKVEPTILEATSRP